MGVRLTRRGNVVAAIGLAFLIWAWVACFTAAAVALLGPDAFHP